MTYFARRTQLQRHLGKDFAFESIEFGEEMPTMKEAVALVEQDIREYIAEKKKMLKKKDLEDEPFPSANPNRVKKLT